MLPRGAEPISHEVHRPGHVGRIRHHQCIWFVSFQPLAGFDLLPVSGLPSNHERAQIQLKLAMDAPDGDCRQSPDGQRDKRVCGSMGAPSRCADVESTARTPKFCGRRSARSEDRRSATIRAFSSSGQRRWPRGPTIISISPRNSVERSMEKLPANPNQAHESQISRNKGRWGLSLAYDLSGRLYGLWISADLPSHFAPGKEQWIAEYSVAAFRINTSAV